MRLSWETVAALALDAGWNKDEAVTAVAIAQAESGRRTDAVSPTRCCYGIWQVNKSHGYTPRQLIEPRTNASAAYKVYHDRLRSQGKRWVDWSVFKSGAYKIHMRRARKAVDKVYDHQDAPLARYNPERLLEEANIPYVSDLLGADEEDVGRVVGKGAAAVGKGAANALSGLGVEIWPALLRVALAGTGLALIGYGIVQMTGTGRARPHVTQAASTVGAVGGGA